MVIAAWGIQSAAGSYGSGAAASRAIHLQSPSNQVEALILARPGLCAIFRQRRPSGPRRPGRHVVPSSPRPSSTSNSRLPACASQTRVWACRIRLPGVSESSALGLPRRGSGCSCPARRGSGPVVPPISSGSARYGQTEAAPPCSGKWCCRPARRRGAEPPMASGDGMPGILHPEAQSQVRVRPGPRRTTCPYAELDGVAHAVQEGLLEPCVTSPRILW